MKKNKILLTNPILTAYDLFGQYAAGGGAYIPHGLASLASYAKKYGFNNVDLIDNWTLKISKEKFIELLKKNQYDIVGIGGCFTSFMFKVNETATLIKSILPDCKIIVGGAHPTIFPVKTLEKFQIIDFLAYNEGEKIFVNFLKEFYSEKPDYRKVKGLVFKEGDKIIMNPPEQLIENLDELPWIDYEALNLKDYTPPPSNYKVLPTYGFLIQRGCPYKCIYCDCRIHGSKIRQHSVQRIISEIDYLVKKFDMKGILFHDSVFTINKKWVIEFCEELLKKKYKLKWMCYTRVDRVDEELLKLMKKAGCWCISYGLESGNQESLNLIKKNTTVEQAIKAVKWTKKAGIEVVASLILCLPGEDEKMAMNTVYFAKKIGVDVAVFFLPVPFPGTELYEICKKEGGLIDNIEWSDYKQWMDQTKLLYINPKIGKENMIKIHRKALRIFYLSPKYLIKTLIKIRSIDELIKYIKGFISIFDALSESFKKIFIKKGIKNL